MQDFYGGGKEDTSRTTPFVLDADEPAEFFGGDTAPNPAEFALHALASCLTTSLVIGAVMRGIHLDEVESTLEGDLDVRGVLDIDESVRNGYQQVRVTFRVKADAPDEVLEELCRHAQERSPVFDMMTNPVPVEVRCERK